MIEIGDQQREAPSEPFRVIPGLLQALQREATQRDRAPITTQRLVPELLLLGEPEAFATRPGYDSSPLLMVRPAQVHLAHLKEPVTDAWRMQAPDALVGDLDEADHSSDAERLTPENAIQRSNAYLRN